MKSRLIAVACAVMLMVASGCGKGRVATSEEPRSVATDGSQTTGVWLPTPFTSEQIRDEWIDGFQLTVRRSTTEGVNIERWRVVDSDPEGVDIEFVTIDSDGRPVGEPAVQRSRWNELRDHALFPAEVATRTHERRATSLGDFAGWLYTVEDPQQGTTSRFFFAEDLPGAPIQLQVLSGDVVVMELEQIERFRPSTQDPD